MTKVCVLQEAGAPTPLKLSEVQHEIEHALQSALQFTCANRLMCFLRYSPCEVHGLSTCLQTEVLQQATKHSILFKSTDGKWFFKWVPQGNQENAVRRVAKNTQGALHLTQYAMVGAFLFFKVPAQLPPLTHDQLLLCIPDFMTKTATALKELHGLGFAHLDVRLPNICFALHEDHHIVKLIDLDRCSHH